MGPIAHCDPRTAGSSVRVTRGASVTAPPVTGYSAWNNAHSSSSPRIFFFLFSFSFFSFFFFLFFFFLFRGNERVRLRHFSI
jgi:hypothetical protein